MTPLNLIRLSAAALFLSASVAVAQTESPPAPAAAAAPAAAPSPAADAAPAPAAYASQKVVYHLNQSGGPEGAGYRGALANIENHLDALGDDNIDLRVVMHGDGVELLQHADGDMQLQGRIAELKSRGVRFLVCNNTLTARDIDPDTLFDVYDDDIVPSGVAELGKLQAEGFAYIRP